MSFKSTLISSFATMFLGSNVFNRVRGVVTRLEENAKTSNLTGEQKRRLAIAEIKDLTEDAGLALASWLINLAIELAVGYLRTKVNQK